MLRQPFARQFSARKTRYLYIKHFTVNIFSLFEWNFLCKATLASFTPECKKGYTHDWLTERKQNEHKHMNIFNAQKNIYRENNKKWKLVLDLLRPWSKPSYVFLLHFVRIYSMGQANLIKLLCSYLASFCHTYRTFRYCVIDNYVHHYFVIILKYVFISMYTQYVFIFIHNS